MKKIIEHIVKSGETLSGIARHYGVSLKEILEVNPQIDNPDLIYPGDVINIPTTVNDEKAEATNSQATCEAKSKNEPNRIEKTSSKIPSRALEASEWARNRKGRVFQPCETLKCSYNYDPKQKGKEACKTPTWIDGYDVEHDNHKDFHSYWFFNCARFVQHAYGVRGKGNAIVMYRKLKKMGLVNENNDVPEGALVFWDYDTWGHVGICSGNGKVIHTGHKKSSREKGVSEDPISEISKRLPYLGWAHVPTDWF